MGLSNIHIRTYWAHITPWWRSEEKWVAWGGLGILILMSLFSVYIAVLFNDWMKDFYDTLQNRDLDAFLHQVTLYIPLVALLLLDFCSRNYLTAWISFRWRRWMTDALSTQWLNNKNYYKIAADNKTVDNPDQRISIDLQEIAYYTVSLFSSFFREGINVVTFSIILWGISNQIDLSFMGKNITFPGFLVWAAIIYSLIGIWITFKVGKPLIQLSRQQERFEADFRYRLMRTFEYREEISFLSGENAEKSRFRDAFTTIRKNYYQILKYQIYVNLFQNFYINGGMFVPLFIVGPAYFTGSITMGILMQTRSIFQEVSGSILTIMTSFQTIAALIAALQRIIDFEAQMHNAPKQNASISGAKTFDIASVELLTPEKDLLWKVPEIHLTPGEHKVLMARSGIGKTSLLRILAGLKQNYRQDGAPFSLPDSTMFIPQRPYMPVGTLRQCLMYPSETCDASLLLSLMEDCQLSHLIPKLDEVQDYQHTLSLGEQQRVNFVRIFLHQPAWLIIDEPVAHLNTSYIQHLCALLREKLPHTGILAISHVPLDGFVTQLIEG